MLCPVWGFSGLSKVKPLKTIKGETDPAACCAACSLEPACIAWTTNTLLGNCYLRDAAGPTNPKPECVL